MTQLFLASASPRRAELLKQIGVNFNVRVADIDETPFGDELAYDYVLRMAKQKALAVKDRCDGGIILAADTSVVIDGEILGKPLNEEDAVSMLQRLSGRSHLVMSSVCLLGLETQLKVSTTKVWFRDMTSDDIDSYCRSGEPLGKAGSYAIQGFGATFVERIDGSYSGVMGLPLFEVATMLRHAGLME